MNEALCSSPDNVIELPDLTECTLYSLDITPTAEGGETLQPGEQYGTIHSTLCVNKDTEVEEEEEWFGEQDRRGREEELGNHFDWQFLSGGRFCVRITIQFRARFVFYGV
jgi:hypothetical protein